MHLHRWNVSKFVQVRGYDCLWLSEFALKCFESIPVHSSTVGKLGYCNIGFSGHQIFSLLSRKMHNKLEAKFFKTQVFFLLTGPKIGELGVTCSLRGFRVSIYLRERHSSSFSIGHKSNVTAIGS